MNCSNCLNNLDGYKNDLLSDDLKIAIKEHLSVCKDCYSSYSLLIIADKVIDEEKTTPFNPFLATRIMSKIESLDEQVTAPHKIFAPKKALQLAIITTSLTVAVFFGILAGNLYSKTDTNNALPEELIYINDSNVESFALYNSQ
jgi:hypothetical protein